MTRNDLIAAVAISFIKAQIKKKQGGTLRFCMLGLESSLVISIAQAAIEDPELDRVLVKISPIFDLGRDLPEDVRSKQSITHWRHCRLPEGKDAVLFAASQEELQRNDKSVEKITKLETDTLRALYPTWIEESRLTSVVLDKLNHSHLEAALAAANETHTARTIEAFSDFVLAIADGILARGLPLQKAIDSALPSLRFPSYSGDFDRIPADKRTVKSEWSKVFRRLHTRIRPLLVQENEKGEVISERLKDNFDSIRNRLDDTECSVIQEFLNADVTLDGWVESQKNLVELDWRRISDLFQGITGSASGSLGEQTVQFFDDEFDDVLDDEERELLSVKRFPREPSDDLLEFFETHKEHLARDKKLSSRWEKYIYRNPETYNDFLVGILSTINHLRERTADEELSGNKIIIRIPEGHKKSFWRGKNARIVRYFAFRYRGLGTLLGEDVDLDFGRLEEFYFSQVDSDLSKVTSRSHEARMIKFEMVLDPEGAKSELIFYWEMPVDALATSMADDLIKVANGGGHCALLATADVARQSVSAKGGIQRISLNDVTTIRCATNKNDGGLVDPNQEDQDCGKAFLEGLAEISKILSSSEPVNIHTAFDEFAALYTKAVRDWVSEDGRGLASKAFIEQAEAYGRLLRSLTEGANNDYAREKLWIKILRIGVVNVGAGAPAAIVAPWHPLRLAEIHIKAKQTVELVKNVLRAEESDIDGADLLFGQVQHELLANYYPEICVGFDSGKHAIVLSATDTRYDYTLCEPPTRDGDDTLDVEPDVAARAFSKVGEQYLNLLPHERSNFSVVLYNAESKALPGALASELSNKVEKENELQCDLLLTHSDPKQMRRIYEQQNVAVSEESGSIMASEAAQNFLSRLRVGFLNATDILEDGMARTADLIVLQDVIARNAKLVWKKAPGDQHPDLIEHRPARWSRRRPVGEADAATAVYLASPSQPLVGQTYLNTIQSYLKGDNALPGDVVPAREVNFRDNDIGDIFRQIHRIGEWVVNFDELVDRRLLKNKGVHVIRHIHDRSVGRNIVVSTTSKPKLLHVLLRKRLNRLDPNIIATNGEEVIDNLILQATELSGQVVMRAARYGRYANELLGVVLSMEQIKFKLGGSSQPAGWYFLDDFASWFGQREEQVADIMAIAPRIENGNPALIVIISEAKYVTSKIYRSQAKKSAKQLKETAARIGRALDSEYKRIDRDIWLHRLGDFMIEGMEPFDATELGGWDLHKWSDEVRRDNVPIKLIGFSHVFVHDEDEHVDAGGPTPLKGMQHCAQQIFDKPSVAAAFRTFAGGGPAIGNGELHSSAGWSGALVSSRDASEDTKSSHENGSRLEVAEPSGFSGEKSKGTPDIPEPRNLKEESVHTQMPANESTTDEYSPDPPSGEEKIETPEKVLSQWPSGELSSWVEKGKILGEENVESQRWLDVTAKSLQRALRSYDMTAELVGVRLTPNAALIRFRGSDDLTVPKVEKRSQELLTSHAIDVINVLAAPMEVVIMVARPDRAVLPLRDLWRQRAFPESAPDSNTSLLLGACESDGELLYLNVDDGFGGYYPHGPHTLIAGETGSGKGVLVQSLLLDICATNSPSNARIIMIDPKFGIDFPWLRRMPHLKGDIITEREEAIKILEYLVKEMERRNRLLVDAGVVKLSHYNRKVGVADRLPRIWLFHDELADWMMIDEYRDAVELSANRLGVKARAAGINLVLVTQRPDKDALPMQLRANLTNRLVLKVADKKNSILVLDEPGAERLLGRGHLAAKLSGEKGMILAQVPFSSEEEIAELADLIQTAWSKNNRV